MRKLWSQNSEISKFEPDLVVMKRRLFVEVKARLKQLPFKPVAAMDGAKKSSVSTKYELMSIPELRKVTF